MVINFRNQARRIGVCDALVGTIDKHTRGDMTNFDIGVVVDAVIAGEGNKDSTCHGLAIKAAVHGVDLHVRDADPVTARFCDADKHMNYGGRDREVNA